MHYASVPCQCNIHMQYLCVCLCGIDMRTLIYITLMMKAEKIILLVSCLSMIYGTTLTAVI